jgi:hypothetical protein
VLAQYDMTKMDALKGIIDRLKDVSWETDSVYQDDSYLVHCYAWHFHHRTRRRW